MAEFKITIEDEVLNVLQQIIQDDIGGNYCPEKEFIIKEVFQNYVDDMNMGFDTIIKVEEIK